MDGDSDVSGRKDGRSIPSSTASLAPAPAAPLAKKRVRVDVAEAAPVQQPQSSPERVLDLAELDQEQEQDERVNAAASKKKPWMKKAGPRKQATVAGGERRASPEIPIPVVALRA